MQICCKNSIHLVDQMRKKKSSYTSKRRKRKSNSHIKVVNMAKHRRRPSFKSNLLSLLIFPLIIQLQLNCDTRGLGLALQTSPSALEDAAGQEQQQQQQQQQQRFLLEPSDTVALVGQSQAQLTCLIGNKQGPLRWFKHHLWLSNEAQMFTDKARYSIRISSRSSDALEPPDSPEPSNATSHLNNLQQGFKSVSNYTLNIANVTLNDDADYHCAIYGSLADDSGSGGNIISRGARLEVVQAPTRLEITTSKVAEDGDDIDGNNERAEQSDNNLQFGHQVVGFTPSSSSSVPESQSESDDQRRPITRIIVKENDRLKLECKANQAKPRAELVWFDAHNRKVPILPTGSGQRDSITANGTTDFAEPFVHIDPEAPRLELATLVWPFRVQRHHHNQILTCRASHKALELQQRQPLEQRVQLEVLYEPTIEGLVKNETLEGQAVKFSCSAHARPSQLNYSWFIDDQPVENANKSHLVVQQLTRQLHMRDVKCLVANSVGNSSAVHRPSVKYSPAYVTHLLPASLQPEPSQHHKFHLFAASRSLSKHATSNSLTPGLGASQLLLAQQLAQGHKEGADVTLRCDFDSNPRPKSIEWFRINTDYDSMTDVTPQEADELIEFGAGHAIFRRPDEAGQVVTVKGAEQQQASHHQKRHIDWNLPATNANNNNHQPENQIQLDYEEMSNELLSELSLYEQNQAAENSSSSSPLFTLINSTDSQTTHTVAKITEPLGWLFVSSPSPGSSNRRTLVNNNTGRFVASHNQYQVLESLQHQQQAVEEELMLMSTQPANSSKLNHRQAQLTSSQLTIKAFNADQSGRYICRANGERPFGSAARGIYLVVRRMPRIISVSQQWAPLGARQVQVECLAQINTVYDNQTAIVWSRNGNIIKPTRQNCDRQQHQDNNSQVEKCIDIQVRFSPDLLFVRSILRVHNSNYQDFGHYNCTITNSFRPDFHIINLQPSAPTGLTFKLLVALTLASVVLCVLIISSILAFAPCKRLDSLATKSAAIIACSSSVCSSPASESSPSPPTGKDSDTKVRNETNSDNSLEKTPGMSMVGYDDVEGAKSMLINNQHLLANMQHGQRARQTAPNRPGSAHGLDSNQRSQRHQNELRSSFRQPQHSSMSLNSNNNNNNNKFAAIHESLESKLQFGRNNLDNYHQQPVSRSTQLEGSTAGSETTTTDVSETATNVISDSNTTATTGKLEPSTNDENGASLMERIWSRLQQRRLDGRTVQGAAAAAAGRRQPRQTRVINGKSRPTISMPIVQKSPLSTGSNSSSLSLRRSSLSDSLTVVNSQLQAASHHQQHSANNVGSHQKNSSRANLIQDNGMASSDGLATSGSSSSGRSSSTSNQQQNANHHHHHHHHHQVAATLSSGQAYLQANEMWPANAIYANSSAVYTNGCDLSTTSYLIDQQQQLAWASSHPEALEQVADLNDANGHYQLPLQMAACNEPYQVTHNNNNNNDNHHQQIDSRPCHPSICNKPNNFQLQTTDAGDAFYESNYGTLISKSSAYKTLGYSNSIAGHNQTGNSITTSTALHINPASQLATTTTLTPPSHHGGSSTASGSPNSLTTHANNTSHTNLSSQQAHILPAHSQLYNHQHVVVSAPQTLYHPNELSLVLNSQESNHFQATTTTMQSDGTVATSALTPNGTSHNTKTNRASPAHLAVANQREPLATHV